MGAIVSQWISEFEFDKLNKTSDQIKDDILGNLWPEGWKWLTDCLAGMKSNLFV